MTIIKHNDININDISKPLGYYTRDVIVSERSYQENLVRGVTGPYTNTCVVASFDRISPTLGVLPEIYEEYEALRQRFVNEVGDYNNVISENITRQYRDLKVRMRAQLGVYSPKNVVEYRANTEEELREKLAKLALGGFRTAVYLDVGGLHAVGVLPIDADTYQTRSTWSPFGDEDVSVSELYRFLDQAPRQRRRAINGKRTVVEDNIVAIPPEPRGAASRYLRMSMITSY